MNKIDVVFIVFFMVMVFIIGFFSNDAYRFYRYQRNYDGLYMQNRTYFEARDITKDYDEFGDWVCINSRGMSFDDCVKTAQHECGHEVFAEFCEDNWEECANITNEK